MTLIFDFDGTLLNSSERLYRLFQDLVPKSTLSLDAYWGLKRQGRSHHEILEDRFQYSQEAIQSFITKWMERIESPDYLQLDSLHEGVSKKLGALAQNHELVLCTCRQKPEEVDVQLKQFGIAAYFNMVLVTSQQTTKDQLIASMFHCVSGDWLIGDTAADIKVAQSLGIQSAAVTSGFINSTVLESYKPTILIDSVLDFNPI